MTLCTIGGTGAAGYNDANARATETDLNDPTALALDDSGRILVSDAANFLIRRFEGDKLMSVVGSNRRSIAIEGVPLQESPLAYVMDMEFAPDGRMGMLETNGRQVSLVDFGADELEVVAYSLNEGWNSEDVTPVEEARFTEPAGIAIDEEGNIFLADAGLGVNMIVKISTEGQITKVAGVDETGFPLSSTSAEPFHEQNHLVNPQGLTWRDGALYVADTGRHRIVSIDVTTGEVTNIVGVNDSPGYGDDVAFGDAKLDTPYRFTFGSDGRMVVADTGNGVIRAEMSDGTIDTICGRGAGGYDANPQEPEGASLGQPFDLLYDASGDLVFTDRQHAVVRRISQPDW